jgi:cell filamentation protein
MRDPYLYEDVPVLVNKLGIKDAKTLEQVEADITAFALADVDSVVADMPFSLLRLLAIHKHIFGDVYEWAGTFTPSQSSRVSVYLAVIPFAIHSRTILNATAVWLWRI